MFITYVICKYLNNAKFLIIFPFLLIYILIFYFFKKMGRLTKILPFPAPKYAYTEGRQDRILLCSLFSLSVFPVSRDLSIIKKEKVKKSYSFFTRKPRQRHLLSLSLSLPPSLCNDIYLSILGRYRQLSLSHSLSLSLSLTYVCLERERSKEQRHLFRVLAVALRLSAQRRTQRNRKGPFFFFVFL